jgi:hypothetical protein
VLVVGSGIIGVVVGCGVTGLANAVPGFICFIKGEVVRTLLENRQVKSAGNVPWFFSDET